MNPFEVLEKLGFLEMGPNGFHVCKAHGVGILYDYEPSADFLTVIAIENVNGNPFPHNLMYIDGLAFKTLRIENGTAHLELGGGSELVFDKY